MEKLETIKNLFAKDGLFTQTDRKLIAKLVKEEGIAITLKNGCGNCYQDAVVMLYSKYKTDILAQTDTATKSGNYRYIYGTPQMWEGKVLCQDTDEATIDEFIKAFPRAWQSFFERIN